MKTHHLAQLEVSSIGYGTMSFASTYGTAPAAQDAIHIIRAAHDLGVTLFDNGRGVRSIHERGASRPPRIARSRSKVDDCSRRREKVGGRLCGVA